MTLYLVQYAYRSVNLKEKYNITQFELDNYKLISQGKSKNYCRTKAGLVIYLNNKFNNTLKITLNTYSTWEHQVIKIIMMA